MRYLSFGWLDQGASLAPSRAARGPEIVAEAQGRLEAGDKLARLQRSALTAKGTSQSLLQHWHVSLSL